MKKVFFLSLILLLGYEANSQQTFGAGGLLPINPSRSVLFGKDIVISNIPEQDQRTVAICSAFNGWLYALYSYKESIYCNASLFKSTDNGLTWNLLHDGYVAISAPTIMTNISIISTGNSLENFKLFFGFVLYDTIHDYCYTQFMRYNGEPFIAEQTFIDMITTGRHDLVLANDGLLSTGKSSAGSIAALFSKNGPKDSVIFYSSIDGGMTFNNRQPIFTTSKHVTKLDLCYGTSTQWNEGRYYAIWDEKESSNPNTGHIYTAHSESGVNSPFTQPICLDSLISSDINLCSNPVISCQYGNVDNDSVNITSVILFEKYNSSNQQSDVKGYYNRQSTISDYFNPFSFTNPNNNNLQPDLIYNPYDSIFLATWYDATLKKLPCVKNDFNLSQPDSWNILSNGYNDLENITDPNPKICINVSEEKAANVWISEVSGGNGVVLFDAQYSTYTGISTITHNGLRSRIFPNPCTDFSTIEFTIPKRSTVNISIYGPNGKRTASVVDKEFLAGEHRVRIDTRNFSAGIYSCVMQTESDLVIENISIIH